METKNIQNTDSDPHSPVKHLQPSDLTQEGSANTAKDLTVASQDSVKQLSEDDEGSENQENGVSTSPEMAAAQSSKGHSTIELAKSTLATDAESSIQLNLNHDLEQDDSATRQAADILFHPSQSQAAESALGLNQNISRDENGSKNEEEEEGSAIEPEDGVASEINGKKKGRKNKKKKNKRANDGASEISQVDDENDSFDADLPAVEGQQLNKQQNNFIDDSDRSRSSSTHSRDQRSVVHESPQFTPLKEKLNDDFFDDQDSSEDEGMPDYKIGGYHPVHVGEILMDRYIIIQKLGWGHFSTVWLTKDLKFNSYVAIKVQKSAQHYLEAAYDEVEILDKVATNWKSKDWAESISRYYKNDPELYKSLSKFGMSGDTSHCVQLLNSFIHHGPNGKHFIMVFEILGCNFLELIKRYNYKGVPIPLVRKLARQCLIGLDYMHRQCKIIHTDFKPENVVIGLRDEEVAEIAKTGQLTTGKMFKMGDWIRQFNMKVAGTLAPVSAPAPAADNDDNENDDSKQAENERVWTDVSFEGLTAKQKKNLRKKLQRKRKLLEKSRISQANESMDDESEKNDGDNTNNDDESAPNLDDINLDDVVIKKPNGEAESKKTDDKKKATTDSLDRGQTNGQLDNLLGQDADKKKSQGSEKNSQELTEEEMRRGPKIRDDVQVKICDMGNGCWTYHHFTPEIQTRQYRSPEVIIGAGYNTSADVWSFACTIFEMITGDFLFEPRKGANYDKDDDHLAQMMELLGRMPKNLALSGKHSRKFFNSKGNLRRISGLCFWPLKKVLTEKYTIRDDEAQALSDFLIPMLTWHHDRRATAEQMLKHPWLQMPANYEYRLTEKEHQILQLKKQMRGDKKEDSVQDDPKQEMNELIDSEPEMYHADDDNMGQRARAHHNDDLSSQEDLHDDKSWADLFDDDELSLEASKERITRAASRKRCETKINNSFTGPYPVDPTDFNHNDKGPNAQFLHFLADNTSKSNEETK